MFKSPSKTAQQFLEKYNFYNYQDTSKYLGKLNKHLLSVKSFDLKNLAKQPLPENPNEIHYCLELGGTFLHLYKFKIHQQKVKIIKQKKVNFYSKKTYTPTVFFNDLTKQLFDFCEHQNFSKLTLVLGFPLKSIQQKNGQIEGKITAFGKQHQTKGLIGIKVAESWQKFLLKMHKLKCQINVINDATANLLACTSNQNPTISLIVGTGTNLGIALPTCKLVKIHNLEFGQYNCFPSNYFDLKLQKTTRKTPGYQTEKMFTGAWINHLFILIYQQILKENLINQKNFSSDYFKNWQASDLEIFFNRYSLNYDFNLLKQIWHQINKRGAFLCALTTAQSIHTFTNHQIIININFAGSILKHSPTFKKTYQQFLQQILTKTEYQKIHFSFPSETAPQAATFLLQQHKA